MNTPKRLSTMVWGLRAALGLLIAVAAIQPSPIASRGFHTGAAYAAGETRAQFRAPPRGLVFTSADAAYEQGLGAVRAGKPEIAIVAFEFAGNQNHVPALYYLGMLYANNDERVTDHAKAFHVFHRIVEQHAYVDPVADFRSVYVVRAAVKLADYYRNGVPALGLKPDAREAVELLNHAAAYFGDLEAQFQLAKMHLTGEGVQGNERYGLHWLSSLARKNHAGAQAFLAELLWRGKFVHKDANQALLWSTLSIEGASEQDRLWIEEIYQTIYCGAAPGVRDTAGQLVADWRRRAPVPAANSGSDAVDRPLTAGRAAAQQRDGHSGLSAGAVRSCANGEPVPTVGPTLAPPVLPSVRAAPAQTQTDRGVIVPMAAPMPAPASTFGQGFREFDKDEASRAQK